MKGYMYILSCADDSYYTGSTKDLELRLQQHQNGEGANHTKKRLPVELVYFEEFDRIDEAFYREKQVQGWSRKKKEALMNKDDKTLHDLAECKNETHYHGFGYAQPPGRDSAAFDSAAFDSAQSPESLVVERSRNHIPALRFSEFEGEWTAKKLENVAVFSKGKGLSKSDIVENGETPCIRYGQLYTEYGEIIDTPISATNVNVSELVLSKSNDVIIPASGESQIDIATASCVLKDGIALGGDLNIIRSKLNGVFLSYYLNNQRKNDIARLAQGISVVHLYSSQLKSLKLSIPTLPEQQKIAAFLTTVDDKIAQLARKKALLEQYKKGVMQKIFPSTGSGTPEIRFDFDSPQPTSERSLSVAETKVNGKDFPEWEEKKLGEVSSNIMYGMNSAAITYDGLNKYIRITDIDENTRAYSPTPLTSPEGELDKKYKLRECDILFTRTGASVGKSYIYNIKDGNLFFAGFLIKFSITGAEPKFVFYQTLLSRYDKWVKMMSMRSGQPGINAEEYKTFKIKLPCLEEQQKIASFLTSIDQKIEQVGSQLEKAKVWKKGLLQKMFV